MFRRLRLVMRGEASARGRHADRPRATNGARVVTQDKALVAAALSDPPAWTNPLSMADRGGRAANACAIVPVPRGMSAGDAGNVAGSGVANSAKGGQEWHSSTAPR